MTVNWTVTFHVSRQRSGQIRYFQTEKLEVDPEEYVLDGIERIWAFHDRSLTFRHACHHSTCGACGMLVNGVEKLTCITRMREVTHDGGTVRIEPLRNFPIVSDLVVDMDRFYLDIDKSNSSQVTAIEKAKLPFEPEDIPGISRGYERLVDCIECGLCISACPAAATSNDYVGPGVLAAFQQSYIQTGDKQLLEMVDCKGGVWRCHSAYECTEVCPSHVNPGWRIMSLRKQIIVKRIKQWLNITTDVK